MDIIYDMLEGVQTVWRLKRTPERRLSRPRVEIEVNFHLLGVVHVREHQCFAPDILYTH